MASTIKRRRFQAPITSFFTTQSSSSSDTSSTPSQPHKPLLSTPPLPETVQSSLLTVGMRIRKSVPEGYKTHKASPLYNNTHSTSFLTNSSNVGSQARTTHSPYTTELTPFCGLHKIGGMAVQPMPSAPAPASSSGIYSDCYARPAEEEGSWSSVLPSSSQESVDSNAPPPAAAVLSNNKRDFLKFDDDDRHDLASQQQQQQQQQHSYTHTFGDITNNTTGLLSPMQGRIFAIPRSRSSHLNAKRAILNGQENLGLGSKALLGAAAAAGGGEVDFDDADFLLAREDLDVGGEDLMMVDDGC